MIKEGDIVEGLVGGEAVLVGKIKPMGSKWSVRYTGMVSKRGATVVIDGAKMRSLSAIATDGQSDFTGDATRFLLYAEAQRICSAYQFDPLFAINCSIVDPLPHQVEAVYKYMLPQPRIRFLLADDTGAGKTIMTGLLLKELMLRGQVERVLIVTPGGLTKQWQEDEMGVKFNISFRIVNREVLTAEPNVFQTANRLIVSIDFVCREEVMRALSSTSWDMVVIDEAHKLSAYEYGKKVYKSKRYAAALALSRQCEHILLLTATPHRGREDTFKRLMQLIDEDIFATPELTTARVRETTGDGVNKFFLRRLKEDMRDWEGNPLYMKRSTKTVSYQLTEEEKGLYDAVTAYLRRRKTEAADTRNVHVSLALQVMQRRLTSSIYAIDVTLCRRYKALQGLADELARNPALWKQRPRIGDDDIEAIDNIDDIDDLDDEERASLDSIMSDPRKLRLFTTAKCPQDIKDEAAEVRALYHRADALYKSNAEEQKYKELRRLLTSQNIVGGEKLVIFTEHKDTLDYLRERLSNSGYTVEAIHGGMAVDERREAQSRFMSPDTQILICTDAAGEGINLQFCRVLVNWDIPWNPNRLEQRMGRIHRYGQKKDVIVFNMVAANTREGQVLKKLLEKLDIIRRQLGDDRVYDVIQDVFKGISLDSIIASVFNGKENELDRFIDKSDDELGKLFRKSISDKQETVAHTTVDYHDAMTLRDKSDEHRLQPIYIRDFFEKAFRHLGGRYETADGDNIYRVTAIPDTVARRLKERYNIIANDLTRMYFFFDKHAYIERQYSSPEYGRAHYINPGNPLFDAVTHTILSLCRNDMLRGTVLVSPVDTAPFFAFLVRSTINDQRTGADGRQRVADETITLVTQDGGNRLASTSPAKLLDMMVPVDIAKEVTPPEPASHDEVIAWAYEHLTEPMLTETRERVSDDIESRRQYARNAFDEVICGIIGEINDLQGKLWYADDDKTSELLRQKNALVETLKERKRRRMQQLDEETELSAAEPEVMGCAYVVPLSQQEYKERFGMSRDDGVEQTAMHIAMDYERKHHRMPEDVSKSNIGYDIRSADPHAIVCRCIEVKGRSGTDGVMLSRNEMNRLKQLGERAWLYIVTDCATTPSLHIINNPSNVMTFKEMVKEVEYYLPLEQWREHEEQ